MNTTKTGQPLGLGSTEGLGESAGPSHAEDRAFWACLVIAQIWGTSDYLQGWPRWLAVLPWMAMALAIRLPYWLRAWRKACKSA